jgi:hypothetical protein
MIEQSVTCIRHVSQQTSTPFQKDVPLPTTEFGQTLLPDGPEANFHLEAVHHILAFWRLQFRGVAGQQLGKDVTEIPVDSA